MPKKKKTKKKARSKQKARSKRTTDRPAAPRLKDEVRVAFAKMLRARAKAEGGFQPLARAITEAYRRIMTDPDWLKPRTQIIDRQKLTRLAKNERHINLSIYQYEAINAYLDNALTRCSFFEFASLVQELAQSSDVAMIVPSRLGQEGPVLSYWDWHATTEVQRALTLFATAPKVNLIDITKGKETAGTVYGQWRHLFGEFGPSVVICIASPRSSRATEHALNLMFRPKSATPARWLSLPFSFVFLNKEQDSLQSKFQIPVNQLKGIHAGLAADVEAGKGWGLIAGDKHFLSQAAVRHKPGSKSPWLQKEIESYGVVAAQRREHQILVVVAGLTGPGSLVTAAGLSTMSANLPPVGDPLENAVLWGVVRATVDTTPMEDGGPPLVDNLGFALKPTLWNPELRRPVESDKPEAGKPPDRSGDKSASLGGED